MPIPRKHRNSLNPSTRTASEHRTDRPNHHLAKEFSMRIRTVTGTLGILAALTLASAAVIPAADTSEADYSIDPVHSTVLFRIRHAGASNFYGRFKRINVKESSFSFDPENLQAATFHFVIDNALVDTGSADRDNHLRTPDFFNVAQYPTTSFTSTAISPNDDGTYEITGDLALHGVTRQVTAQMKWIGEGSFQGVPVAGFEASFEIKRSDFAMTKYLSQAQDESGPLGNTVGLLISVEARRAN